MSLAILVRNRRQELFYDFVKEFGAFEIGGMAGVRDMYDPRLGNDAGDGVSDGPSPIPWAASYETSSSGRRLIRARTGAVATVGGGRGSESVASTSPDSGGVAGMNRHRRLRTPGK